VYELIGAHPLLSQRVDVVLRPYTVLQPSLLRFLFLGYLFCLASYLITSINTLMTILNPRYGELLAQGNAMQAMLSVFRFEQPIASAIYFLVLFAYLASIMTILATFLRSALTQKISGRTHLVWFLATLAQISIFAIGNILGDAFHPYSQSSQLQLAGKVMLGQAVDGLFFNRIRLSTILKEVVIWAMLLGTAILFWLEANFILAGSRSKIIKAWQWGALMIFSFLGILQISGALWAAYNFPEYANSMGFIMAAVPTFVFFIIVLVFSCFMRGPRRTNDRAPGWLVSE
jgi:hypothetical protein